ncbi:sugar phosphate isomerase/epimerase [Staphylococcus sp. 18_1_E_LY]|uniref:Sugar phosphate isomerase/epimerase n=1 Tax=Staphylococcus lloydii TaxID=2781774 RepID=A0A7T1F9L2_9STAP|nr:sugar phosphate isomerase/epimerase [Staphylococcus lloydii]MBF7019436.1 sugar phosphate isomerase/epimerase [Staphylococcus lloydii]MBF7027163.1 sugar phosphate isomerase/epimerase [Staphylococcus lloydii]QPM74806.1 sugar phosphate isomerase/epimerase [Staphylococcus lloydii]
MKIGVFTVLFQDKNFEEMLDHVAEAGVKAVEIGTGGNPGNDFCDVEALIEDEKLRQQFSDKIHQRGLTISALSCHDNPISPNKAQAKQAQETFKKTVKLASLLDIPVVNTFSGVAGSDEKAEYPNWPVTPWPTEYSEILKWQWEEKLIPYWKEAAQYAKEHGVKIGIELHAGFLVHTPYTLLKLREATNDALGANLDPSHLWWQGIDPIAAIKILGKENAIHHFHAKDTYIDQENVNMYGLTDMQPYSEVKTRAWTFRTVGYGHAPNLWGDIISALRMYGYDYVVSIEHEDPIMSIEEGFQKAVTNLNSVNIEEPAPDLWWT